jgi:hypothetical protein
MLTDALLEGEDILRETEVEAVTVIDILAVLLFPSLSTT